MHIDKEKELTYNLFMFCIFIDKINRNNLSEFREIISLDLSLMGGGKR